MENLRLRLELLGELKGVEAAARSLYADARKRWPQHVPVSDRQPPIRTAVGIP